MHIRDAVPADAGATRRLLIDPFAGEDGARIVDVLRGNGVVRLELVAEFDGEG